MFTHCDFDGAATPLSLVKLRDGIWHRAAYIIGKVKVEIVDGDINRRTLMRFNTLGEVSWNSNDCHDLDPIVQVVRLPWICIGDAKNIGTMKDLGHLHPFGARIQGYQCD